MKELPYIQHLIKLSLMSITGLPIISSKILFQRHLYSNLNFFFLIKFYYKIYCSTLLLRITSMIFSQLLP
jgi:hypothetical protein